MGVDHPEVIALVAAAGGPAVIVNGMDRAMRLSSVSPDYHFGAALATRHLLNLGHRDIVHVTHPYRETIRRRIDSFRNALEEFGLPFNPRDHLLDLEAPANISLAARDIVLTRLSRRASLPTAIFCMNDMVALAVIQAVQAMGLSVPEDISVIGFDGLAIGGYATPQLSSIRTDRAALGRIGVERLVQMLGDTLSLVQRVTLGAELLAKRSTMQPWT